MFSRFFIDRPIFANVIAIVTMIVGAVAIFFLPIEQYPSVTPPTVQVVTVYPGANAQVLADTVAGPIEDEVNGVEKMLYMSSTCSADGSYNLTVTFEVGTDLDTAQVLVQNRVDVALPRLPEEVRRQGVNTKKQSTNILFVITLTSPDKSRDALFLSNYATLRVRDELSRVYGVGEAQVFGAGSYSMRLWLDPEKLKARRLTTQDVLAAIREQNVQVAAGQVGAPPAADSTTFQYTLNTQGRLADPDEFGDIIIKADADGERTARITRVRDVARVELGAQTYDMFCEVNGETAAGVAIFLLPGANALEVARQVKARVKELERNFPPGVTYSVPYDTTIFVEQSISEVYTTLYQAGALVLVVILVFLQDWRALLVPATTVPVTIIGTFGALAALGFSINMLTLFGLVLAIGIVVDDAIVIVENAVHHIDRDGLAPREATIRAMDEVLGPIIGITLVLMAVFLPTAFLGGITGQLYRQFALTIAATAIISAVNALTLKPAQCASYLRPTPARRNPLARLFNGAYDRVEGVYAGVVGWLVRHTAVVMLLFAALVAGTGWGFARLPTGFLPIEDQGYGILGLQLPDSASLERTHDVVRKVGKVLKETRGVKYWVTIGGTSLLDQANASNAAVMYLAWEPWEERTAPDLSQEAILGALGGKLAAIPEAIIFAFPPPAIMGLGVAGGFEMVVEDRGAAGLGQLQQATDAMVAAGNAQSRLRNLTSTFRAGVPQLYVDIDRVKVKSEDVPLGVVFETLQAQLGSAYVNDFNTLGRTFQVRVQADSRFRLEPEDVRRLEVRNRRGAMIPLGTLATVRPALGPQIITRYNKYPAARINGESAPGSSSGQAMGLMEQVGGESLNSALGFDWTGMSYQEKKVGSQALYVFGLAVLMVYLVLAAQYESWLMPLAVILVVPLALLGTVAAVAIRGLDVNVYTQIGIVLIIALASKNAILIVEFARELRRRGRPILAAAVEASRLRFRPILMTSFAFILGVYPLVGAEGAGAASRRALGTAVFGGMITSTVLAVFFVPAFFVVIQRLIEWRHPQETIAEAEATLVGANGHDGVAAHGPAAITAGH